MIRNLLIAVFAVSVLMSAGAAHAWFFFIPTGAIQRAMETDPDSIAASALDRLLGQCAGYHLNQAQRGMSRPMERNLDGTGSGMPQQEVKQTPESKFHSSMADAALKKSAEADKVKQLAEAYSVRWGRVASAGDQGVNRQYGGNLARGCLSNDIPVRFVDYAAWQSRQEDASRRQAEDARKRAEDEQQQRRQREQEVARSDAKTQSVSSAGPSIDYIAEGKKSARILGCPTDDVKVVGAESNNVLVTAVCPNGAALDLTCDRTGTCLKR